MRGCCVLRVSSPVPTGGACVTPLRLFQVETMEFAAINLIWAGQ